MKRKAAAGALLSVLVLTASSAPVFADTQDKVWVVCRTSLQLNRYVTPPVLVNKSDLPQIDGKFRALAFHVGSGYECNTYASPEGVPHEEKAGSSYTSAYNLRVQVHAFPNLPKDWAVVERTVAKPANTAPQTRQPAIDPAEAKKAEAARIQREAQARERQGAIIVEVKKLGSHREAEARKLVEMREKAKSAALTKPVATNDKIVDAPRQQKKICKTVTQPASSHRLTGRAISSKNEAEALLSATGDLNTACRGRPGTISAKSCQNYKIVGINNIVCKVTLVCQAHSFEHCSYEGSSQ